MGYLFDIFTLGRRARKSLTFDSYPKQQTPSKKYPKQQTPSKKHPKQQTPKKLATIDMKKPSPRTPKTPKSKFGFLALFYFIQNAVFFRFTARENNCTRHACS